MEKETFKFSGSGAENYDRYLGPVLFEPYAAKVAAVIQAPDTVTSVLEIASGTGRVTRHLRQRFNAPVRFVASDFSADMIAVAQAVLNDATIEFRVEDAQHLSFPDGSFDVVVCQFGLMFLQDKKKGLSEALRVLKPGGRVMISTWDKTEHMPLLNLVFNENILPNFKPEDAQRLLVPFSLHDPAVLRAWMEQANFTNVNVQRVVLRSGASTPENITNGFFSKHSIGQEVMASNKEKFEAMEQKMRTDIATHLGNPASSELAAFFVTGEKGQGRPTSAGAAI